MKSEEQKLAKLIIDLRDKQKTLHTQYDCGIYWNGWDEIVKKAEEILNE